MARRPIRVIGQALGRRGRTYATASVMRRWCTPTAASVPIVCKRNAGRSPINSCMLIASRASANRRSSLPGGCYRDCRSVARQLTIWRCRLGVGFGGREFIRAHPGAGRAGRAWAAPSSSPRTSAARCFAAATGANPSPTSPAATTSTRVRYQGLRREGGCGLARGRRNGVCQVTVVAGSLTFPAEATPPRTSGEEFFRTEDVYSGLGESIPGGQIARWVLGEGPHIDSGVELFDELCWLLFGDDVPLWRATYHVGVLHPQIRGIPRRTAA